MERGIVQNTPRLCSILILVMRDLPTVCTDNGKEGIKNLGRHGKRLTLCTQTFAVTAE